MHVLLARLAVVLACCGRCDGRIGQCAVFANNRQFGEPCSLTPKYLEVQYHCVEPRGWLIDMTRYARKEWHVSILLWNITGSIHNVLCNKFADLITRSNNFSYVVSEIFLYLSWNSAHKRFSDLRSCWIKKTSTPLHIQCSMNSRDNTCLYNDFHHVMRINGKSSAHIRSKNFTVWVITCRRWMQISIHTAFPIVCGIEEKSFLKRR